MRKGENITKKISDDEKDTILKELSNSVHNYIKTSVKNRQLDFLIELEEEFQKKYKRLFDINQIVPIISSPIVQIIYSSIKAPMVKIETECKHMIELKNISDRTMLDKKINGLNIDIVSEQIEEVLVKKVYNILEEIIKNVAYLSHVNMLFELYEQEEYIRREEAEYEKISMKFQNMDDIVKVLNKERRMEVDRLQKYVGISEKKLEELLSQCRKYFIVREKQENIQISLSPAGKKYHDYINSQEKYSKNTLNQLVYKNCDKLMETLENSYDRGVELELKLDEISPEKDRALQLNYHRIVGKFIYEEIYTTKDYIIKEKKESVDINNEKNRIRIPRT